MGSLLKNFSILKKFLFINLIIFIVIGILTILYLNFSKPNLIYKKTDRNGYLINFMNSEDFKSIKNIFREQNILLEKNFLS